MTSAGDVEKFAYCAHNWQRAKGGAEGTSSASRRGVRLHNDKDEILKESASLARLANRALILVLGLGSLAGLLTLGTVLLLTDGRNQLIILIIASITLALGVSVLTLSLIVDQRSKDLARSMGLPVSKSPFRQHAPPLLEDKQLRLRGRPDAILPGGVPVEVKSGHTPREPHASHRMQLAAYLHLQNANGARPSHGIISYPEHSFHVEWDETLRNEFLSTMIRLRQAEEVGKADRDHENPILCRNCARRDGCTQALG